MRHFLYLGTLLKHLVGFAVENKVYWIVPLVLVLGLLAALVVAAQSTTPFIYTLF